MMTHEPKDIEPTVFYVLRSDPYWSAAHGYTWRGKLSWAVYRCTFGLPSFLVWRLGAVFTVLFWAVVIHWVIS